MSAIEPLLTRGDPDQSPYQPQRTIIQLYITTLYTFITPH